MSNIEQWTQEAKITKEQAGTKVAQFVENSIFLLHAQGIDSGKVFDAGAGLGRNSIFLAENGFQVVAIEVDGEQNSTLAKRIADKGLSNINLVKEYAQNAIREIHNDDLSACIDYGTSSYMSSKERKAYGVEITRTLRVGGLVVLHFADDPLSKEQKIPNYASNFLDLNDFEVLLKDSEKGLNGKIRYTLVLRKMGQHLLPVSEVVSKAMDLMASKIEENTRKMLEDFWDQNLGLIQARDAILLKGKILEFAKLHNTKISENTQLVIEQILKIISGHIYLTKEIFLEESLKLFNVQSVASERMLHAYNQDIFA